MIKALNDSIIFQFTDKVNSKGEFEPEQPKSGIVLTSSIDNSAKSPRKAVVVSVGPKVTDVVVGDVIVIPALRWTSHISLDGQKYWRTTENEVVGKIVEDKLRPRGEFVTFIKLKQPQVYNGLIYVAQDKEEQVNTKHGEVLATGTKATQVQQSDEILYASANMNDDIFVGSTTISFIKETDIIAVRG